MVNFFKIIQSGEKSNIRYKNHQTGTTSYHEILVPPTTSENVYYEHLAQVLWSFTYSLVFSHLLCCDNPVGLCQKRLCQKTLETPCGNNNLKKLKHISVFLIKRAICEN